MKHKPYYEVYQGADDLWRWRQVAGNGQKTGAQGEPSASKRNAVQAVVVSARIAAELTRAYGDFSATDGYIYDMLRENQAIRITPRKPVVK